MTDENGHTAATEAAPNAELLEILRAVAELDALVATEGLVDLSAVVPEDVTYRVPLMTGETVDYSVPGDIPFTMTLAFLRARDRFARSQAALSALGNSDETGRSQEQLLAAMENAWDALIEALVVILAIRQPDVSAADLARVPNAATRNLVGALWLRLMGLRLKPFSKELTEESDSPKAEGRASTPAETEPASST